MKKASKEFDCIEMKRAIQERIYLETKDMTRAEFDTHMRNRIKASRFASFLDGRAEVSRVPALDTGYLHEMQSTLGEWNSQEDEEAYRDL